MRLILLLFLGLSCSSGYTESYFSEKLNSFNEQTWDKTVDEDLGKRFRFMILPAFGESKLIKINIDEDDVVITVKAFVKIKEELKLTVKTKSVKKEKFLKALKLLESISFSKFEKESEMAQGMDGENWIIETLSKSRYDKIERWSPNH